MTMPFAAPPRGLEAAQRAAHASAAVVRANALKTAPECLGCNLLALPERCVEYADGVRCDECA